MERTRTNAAVCQDVTSKEEDGSSGACVLGAGGYCGNIFVRDFGRRLVATLGKMHQWDTYSMWNHKHWIIDMSDQSLIRPFFFYPTSNTFSFGPSAFSDYRHVRLLTCFWLTINFSDYSVATSQRAKFRPLTSQRCLRQCRMCAEPGQHRSLVYVIEKCLRFSVLLSWWLQSQCCCRLPCFEQFWWTPWKPAGINSGSLLCGRGCSLSLAPLRNTVVGWGHNRCCLHNHWTPSDWLSDSAVSPVTSKPALMSGWYPPPHPIFVGSLMCAGKAVIIMFTSFAKLHTHTEL